VRRWERAVVETLCGACPRLIPINEPMQLIKLPGVRRELKRCHECAQGDPPPDLPLIEVRSRFTKRMAPLRKAIPREWMPYRED